MRLARRDFLYSNNRLSFALPDSDSDSDLISFVAKEAVNNIVNAVSSWKTEGHRDRDKETQTDREGGESNRERDSRHTET